MAMADRAMPDDVRQRIKRIRTVRWVLIAVTAALAITLIVHGNVLIGLLMAAVASMRAWMLFSMPRRMEAVRQRQRDALGRGDVS